VERRAMELDKEGTDLWKKSRRKGGFMRLIWRRKGRIKGIKCKKKNSKKMPELDPPREIDKAINKVGSSVRVSAPMNSLEPLFSVAKYVTPRVAIFPLHLVLVLAVSISSILRSIVS
jgi:hypothetical protein